MSVRLSLAATVAFAAIITIGALAPGNAPPAVAQDAQTNAMIWHFNVYRMQNGAAPLYTHPDLSTLMQNSAQQSADACGPILPPKPSYASQWSRWYEFGGETADIRWNYDWSMDPLITSRVANPDFNSVGVGRALSHCSQGWTWTAAVAKVNGSPSGPNPTPTGPVQPTPSPPPPTPSPSPSPSNQTPTPSPGSSSPTPTATPSVSSTGPAPTTPTSATVSPTPTGTHLPTLTPTITPTNTAPPANGDANCDTLVSEVDGMLVLFLAADIAALAPCLAPRGVDCTGLVDQFDVLSLFRYLAGLNPNIPASCPPIGVHMTPSPSPTAPATVTPTAVPTPGPTVVPGSIAHCFLALASYEVTFAPALSGGAACSVPDGVDYSCDFPGHLNNFTCDSSSPSMPDRDCYVLDRTWAYCAVAQGQQGTAYQCSNSQGISQCFPIEDPASPLYICVADETAVTCLTEAAFPDFHCARTEQDFACAAIID